MLGRPMEYQSLKTVLQHMDANIRFRINLHMPSIRNVEKVVPLKIKSFSMCDCVTQVNDTSYNLGIFRHYPRGKTPEPTKEVNRTGGLRRDFDEFGFSVNIGSSVMLPGDVSFEAENQMNPFELRYDAREEEEMHRMTLGIHEKALEKRTELKSKGILVESYLRSLEPIPDDEFYGEDYLVRENLKHSSEDLLRFIEEDKLKLLPFECQRNNTKPPFTCYIQLTITKGKSTQIQRFAYNKKLYEAAKHLNEVLFGDRRMPIRIGSIDSIRNYGGVFRLPTGFRLQVKKSHLSDDMLTHRSFPLIVENWKSLGSLWLYCNVHRSVATQNQVARNAKRLVITGASELQRLAGVLGELPNREISILPVPMTYWPEEYFGLVRAWLTGDRQVGASCWIRMANEKTMKPVLQMVWSHYESTERTEGCVKFLTNNFAKAEVYYDIFEGPKRYFENICELFLKITIVNA